MNCVAIAEKISPGLATVVLAVQERLPSIIVALGSLEWTIAVLFGMVLQQITKSWAARS